MLAATAVRFDAKNPLAGLVIGDRPEPEVPEGWTTVEVAAATLNHHDLWTLQGVGITEDRLPMILGCDAAGVDTETGAEVIVYPVIGDAAAGRGDETLDPGRSLLSEIHPGTLAERVAVPRTHLVPKPADLTWEAAACLPTAWLTAYRMLFRDAGLAAGDTVLVQGAGGGVATAAVQLARAAGFQVWVTSRDEAKRARALSLGAHDTFESGARLPARVDAVIETVGAATWAHSLRSLRPGGTVVVSGATSGYDPPAKLNRVFFLQLRIIGSTMGSLAEMRALVDFVAAHSIVPLVDSVIGLDEVGDGLARLHSGEAFGKVAVVRRTR